MIALLLPVLGILLALGLCAAAIVAGAVRLRRRRQLTTRGVPVRATIVAVRAQSVDSTYAYHPVVRYQFHGRWWDSAPSGGQHALRTGTVFTTGGMGQRVAAYARKDVVSGGTYAEYVAVPAASVAAVPEGVSDEAAAGLPLAGLTALRSLEALDPLGPGDTLLIHAASGGVGHLAAQLAVAAGATVLGTASQPNHERLRALGVTPLSYGEGLPDRVREHAPDGVTAVADFAGGVLDDTLAVLRPGGRHISIADPGAAESGGRWIWVRPDGARLATLLRLVAEGSLTVEIDRVFPLAEGAETLALSRDGQARGKLIIDVTR